MWSAQDETKISKLSVLKPQQYPAFNLHRRQHPTAVGRASPDLLDSPTRTIAADVHHIASPSCARDSPVLAMPPVPIPGTAKQGSAYTAEKPLAKPEGDVEISKDVAGGMGKR